MLALKFGLNSQFICASVPISQEIGRFECVVSYEKTRDGMKPSLVFWQGQKGSNPRPTVLETGTLPTELYPCICALGDFSRRFQTLSAHRTKNATRTPELSGAVCTKLTSVKSELTVHIEPKM